MSILDFKHLFFADIDFDITDFLTTIGVQVSVGGTVIKQAYSTSALGSEPDTIDCTPLAAKQKMSKTGLKDLGNWTIDYYMNDTDYAYLDGLVTSGTEVELAVAFDNGTKFTNKGAVKANYLTDLSVGAMGAAECAIELSGDWSHTSASAG